MKILEQTSTKLVLQDSVAATWGIRLFSLPFLILGGLGLALALSEAVLPSFFVILCLIFGCVGFFLPAVQRVVFDKSVNQLQVKVQRLWGTSTREYPLDQVRVRLEKTAFQVKKNSLLSSNRKEALYILWLEINSALKVKISGNYSFTKQKATDLVDLIRTFLNAQPE